METTRVRISYRVTPDCKRFIEAIARTLGISATAVIEVMAREKAQQLGIALTPKRQQGRD